jgi:hypothetical protein
VRARPGSSALRRGGPRGSARLGSPKTGSTEVDAPRACPSTARIVNRTSREGSWSEKLNLLRPRSRRPTTRPSTLMITISVPGLTFPTILPNETSYGRGVITTGGAGGVVASAGTDSILLVTGEHGALPWSHGSLAAGAHAHRPR